MTHDSLSAAFEISQP